MSEQVKGIIMRIVVGVVTIVLCFFLIYLTINHSLYYIFSMLLMILFSVFAYLDSKRDCFWLALAILSPLSCIAIFLIRSFIM